MGTCGMHFFGSNVVMDALTEHRLGTDLSVRMDAISDVFKGMGHWQKSYVADIEGDGKKAVKEYKRAQKAFSSSFRYLKAAELERAKLVSHFLSVDKDFVVRPSVKTAFTSQDVGLVMQRMKSEGRLPDFVTKEAYENFAKDVAFLRSSVSELPSTGDKMIDIVIAFFAVDLQKMREIKESVKNIMDQLESEKKQVERGTLYESLGYSIHSKGELYGLSKATASVRVKLVEYISFVELYGGLVTNSLLLASDEDAKKWSELEPLLK